MKLLELFRRNRQTPQTASLAKQRLQVLLALERTTTQSPDFLPLLQRELLEVIRKYVEVDEDRIKVEFERDTGMSMLAVSVEIPSGVAGRAV